MRIRTWTFRGCLLPIAASLLAAPGLDGADLKIVELSLRQYEGGQAWIPGYSPVAGETFAFDFKVDGFASVEGDFDDKIKLRFQAELVDSDGKPFAKPVSGESGVDVTEEDKKKDWKPKFSGEFQLPVLLRRQPATLRINVEDLVAEAKTTAERTFSIAGPEIPSDAPLGAQNFRFLRTEEDTEPLATVAYRQGDMVWGRFEISGFQTAEDGEVHVDYGLEVTTAEGKSLYAEEIAAEERKQFFYPPAYIPGVVSLQLQPNTPLGSYTIRLIVRDRRQGVEAESLHRFRIE
jgi:hypothetical protein